VEVAIDEGGSGFGGTQNPADALDFLARVASNADEESKSRPSISQEIQSSQIPAEMGFGPPPSLSTSAATSNPQNSSSARGFASYRPMQEGHLSIPDAQKLVQR